MIFPASFSSPSAPYQTPYARASSHPCIIYTFDFNRLISASFTGGGAGRAPSFIFHGERSCIFPWISFCFRLENYFFKTNSKLTLIFIKFLGIGGMVAMYMVISISAGGGLVAGVSERRPACHLLMLRNGHLLWGWNRDARKRLKPRPPGTQEPTDL